MARVKVVGSAITAEDVDVVGQQVVESSAQLHRINRFPASQMSHMRHRTHPGVGASGPTNFCFSLKLTGNTKDVTLHGLWSVRLRLPPRVARPLVFESQFVSRHSLSD